MNAMSQWRLKIAERIGPLYAANPNVAAVIAGGSSARGYADRYSDIEIGVFWHRPPTDEERTLVIEQAGGDLLGLDAYDADAECWGENYTMGRRQPDESKSGVTMDIVHYTTESMQRALDLVLNQHHPDELKQTLIAGVMYGLPLSGAELIEQWKARAAAYPKELAMAVVNRHAMVDYFWRWEMWLHRGDNRMLVYQSFSQVEQRLLHVLLGINRVYYFGFKWLDVILEQLPIAPPDFSNRLKRVFHVEPTEGAQLLTDLVEDTYDLIETHLPEIDVDWLRTVFRHRRPLWEQAPPMTSPLRH